MHDAHLNSRHTPQRRSYTAHSSDRQSKTICGPSPSRPTANESTLDSFVTFLTRYTPSPTRPTANESALDSFQFCGPSPTRPTANESTLDSFVIFLTRYTPSPTRPTANESALDSFQFCSPSPTRPTANESTLDSKRVHVGLVCNISRTLHPFTRNNGSAGWKINWDMIGVAKVLRLQEFGRLISETNESTLDSFARFPARYTPSPTRPTANESNVDSFAAIPARYTARYTPYSFTHSPDSKRVERGLVCRDSRTLHRTLHPILLHPLARQQTSRTWTRLPRFPHATPHATPHTPSPTRPTANESNVDSFAAIPARYTPQAIPVANESTFDSFAAFPARYTPQAFPAANESTFDSFVAAFDSFAAIPARYTPQAFPAANEFNEIVLAKQYRSGAPSTKIWLS
ncbi:hypothetical protein GGU10DRAFT_406579 [Lentinula aff. detonsa]|uniref:Uncharacterized protein n=1 Tax=Lentinula aff. detonsa TaxID=2804958 RepID=A0AA38NKQ3_9AGAR|nr:hypothetical protein GGU10DRAFT_406579 [Lentinula aff. detonsa]